MKFKLWTMKTKKTLVVLTTSNENLYDEKFFEPIGPNKEVLFEYNILDAIEVGFEKIILVAANNMKEFIQNNIKPKFKNTIEIYCVYTNPMSRFNFRRTIPNAFFSLNSYALWKTKRYIKGSFLIIDGRFYHGKNVYKKALSFMSQGDDDIAVINCQLDKILSRYGGVDRSVCLTKGKSDRLSRILELKKIRKQDRFIAHEDNENIDLSEKMLATTGVFCLNTSFFGAYNSILKSYRKDKSRPDKPITIPNMINHALTNEICNAKVLKIESKGFGINHKPDRIMAMHKIKDMIAQNSYPRRLPQL